MKVQRFNIQDHKIKCLVYGESGSGKTVFGSTAPNPFWLSAEGGLASVMHTNPIGVEIKSLKDLKDAYIYLRNREFEKDQIEVNTVVIDSITEINDIIKDEIKARKGGRELEGRDWGKVQDEIKTILRNFRDLPLHVIFISLAKESKDEEKIDKVVPMLNGQAARDIAAYMDLVCFIGIDKTGEHFILTKGSQKYLTKDRFNQFPVDIEPNFAIMQGFIENLKTGENQLVRTYENNGEIKKEEEKLPDVPVGKKITADQAKQIIVMWSQVWELFQKTSPDEKDSKGNLKYTDEKSEPTRKATMKQIIGVDSTTNMTSDQAEEFIKKLEEKIINLNQEIKNKEKPSGDNEKASKIKKETKKEIKDTEEEKKSLKTKNTK